MKSDRSIPALAIIGMAGRFPGGQNLADFWALLEQGRSAVRKLSDQELRDSGVAEPLLSNPSYVKCCRPLEGAELFDASFFGYSPRQAASIDPQQRLFLEFAWEALERAGYGSIPPNMTAGVFGGSGFNGYLERSMLEDGRTDPENAYQSFIDSGKDLLTGRVAYKLGLTGPSITVQTACSTSLVAVHLASQSLLSYECDIALAGGIAVQIPPHSGYLHVEGSILSRDGVCRAFDADASGTTPGDGAGVVVLRRLEDAEADGDSVLAIVRSTVVNNDGSRKVGFTAPGLDSQVRLLRAGLELAGLGPADIDLVEGHGTGTTLGDSIELTALQEVYASRRGRHKTCVLGSVKSNVGHTDAAAGIAGLIKVVLCLQHKMYVPNAGFRKPNPLLASAESAFRVCTASEPWPVTPGRPRRAAVSSFGVGGTNAHAIIEEATNSPATPLDQQAQLLPISARTSSALAQSCERLATHLEIHELQLRDVAFTLQVGRRSLEYRRFIVGTDRREVVAALRAATKRESAVSASARRPTIFLFPGQGTQRLGMLADIYATDRDLSRDVDRCAQKMLELQGQDLSEVLCRRVAAAHLDIDDTEVTQPALFIAEYCLARFWSRQGLTPAAVLGHSVGEYAAACMAGVIEFEDALQLVAHRARLSRDLPDGAMVAINLPESEVARLLIPTVKIAAVNASRQCVVSGVSTAMQDFIARLEAVGIEYQRLAVSKPFHTEAVAPLASRMLQMAKQLQLSSPRIPWISSVTGARVSDSEARDPEHWANHVLMPVRFASALRALGDWENCVFLEVGPGRVLSGFARHELGSVSVFASMPTQQRSDRARLLEMLGELWLAGAAVDFTARPRGEARRIELPPHPLERRSYLKVSGSTGLPLPRNRLDERLAPEHWFSLPSWQRSLFPSTQSFDSKAGSWLLFMDDEDFAESLANRLRRSGQDVICVRGGASFTALSRDEYTLSAETSDQLNELFGRLDREDRRVGRIIDCTTLSENDESFDQPALIPKSAIRLAQVARAVRSRSRPQPLSVLIVTNGVHDISGYEQPLANRAILPVFCKCAAQELPNTRCVTVDLPRRIPEQRLALQYSRYEERLLAELEHGSDTTAAYRHDWRFIEAYVPVELGATGPALRSLSAGGLYVITGGLGRIGLALGERLAREYRAKLLLLSRRTFPSRDDWKSIVSTVSSPNELSAVAQRLLEMEALGAEVMVATADVSDTRALAEVLAIAERRFGPIRGVFHLAVYGSEFRQIAELEPSDVELQLRPKATGLAALVDALGDRQLDFAVAFSSSSAVLGGVGYGAYAAANAVMDSIVSGRTDERLDQWMTVNWDGWTEPGGRSDPYGISFEEGLDALWRICLYGNAPQFIVSATPLEPRIDTWVRRRRAAQAEPTATDSQASLGDVLSARVLPRSALERRIAEIWQEALGLETVGVTESFLELGGDSLISVRVISRIKESFHVSVSPASLLGLNNTVEALSRDIVRAMAETHAESLRD